MQSGTNKLRILYRYLKMRELKNGFLAISKKNQNYKKKCIICGDKVNKFYPYGVESDFFKRHNVIGGGARINCLCLHCQSIDRSRWQYYIIKKYTGILTDNCSVLHIAPEQWLQNFIKQNKHCAYYGGDIRPGVADHVVDLTNMGEIEDNHFDYVIVNHVMEHIPEENIAFSEIKRVLKEKGKLILSFPICTDAETYEDPGIDTDQKRLYYYGQENHVRLYGNDYKERIEKYGFRVKVFRPIDELSREEIEMMGLISNDVLMICSKDII